jgi:hypothetical protein
LVAVAAAVPVDEPELCVIVADTAEDEALEFWFRRAGISILYY